MVLGGWDRQKLVRRQRVLVMGKLVGGRQYSQSGGWGWGVLKSDPSVSLPPVWWLRKVVGLLGGVSMRGVSLR